MKLEKGDRYLSISVKSSDLLAECLKAALTGEKYINIAAFKNKEKDGDSHPDYKSAVCAVWIKEKKEGTESSL